MGGLVELLEEYKRLGPAPGGFLGLLNILIGRRIQKPDGTVLSTGLTWRDVSLLLKKTRWDIEAVRDLGLDPVDMPPRDRQRYWYAVIGQANVDSEAATKAGDQLAERLKKAGYAIGHAPQRAAKKKG